MSVFCVRSVAITYLIMKSCKLLSALLIFVFLVSECFNLEFLYEKTNDSDDDADTLFGTNMLWNQGDIPLLNRKIFKGFRVPIREHPYIASIRRNIMHYSVASMLTKNLFITVALPLVDVPLDELGIVVGENYADRGAVLLTVMLVIMHEEFDRYSLNANLALLRVYEDTPYRCAVKSIQLIHPKAYLNGLRAIVTGWGRCDRTGKELCLPRSGKYTPGEKFDPMLRSVSFIISIPNLYCEGYRKNSVHLKPGMLCAGRSREEDKVTSCLAVPGAPLVVNAHLTGILSWGFGCGYENDLPLVYTNLQYYQPWLVHNIPILRRISRDNLTLLFEVKRAHILSKWLNLTRVFKPEPFFVSDRPMETLKLDRELAKLKGRVYDIRDYIFEGIYRKYKKTLYEKLRDRRAEKEAIKKNHEERTSSAPFLNLDMYTTNQNKFTLVFMDQTQQFPTDGENIYYEDYP